ncbi:MAG: hypothetical protein VX254_03620 [Planctomycetota bacterium]|nr:hypothetical protein [Planctomycetota bacterium]
MLAQGEDPDSSGGVKVRIGEPVYPDEAALEESAGSQAAPFGEYKRLIAEVEARVNDLCGKTLAEPVDCVAD